MKKIKIIYIPYIIAVIIYYLFFVYILDYFPFSFKELFGYMLRGNVAAQFYFVIVIMQFFILYPVWKYISNKNPVIVMTISVILTVVLGLYMIFIIDKLFNGYYFDSIDSLFTTYLMYWAGGIFAGKYYKKFIGFVNKRAVIISVVFAVCAIADAITFYMYKIYILPPRHLNVIHAAYCISAILFCMMLCYKMRNKRIKFIDIIDRASYYIYLYHVLFIFIIDYLLQQLHIEIPSTTGMFALRFLITYSVIFIFAKIYCYVIKLLKRNS
ncbi:MAG: acyltransferase family protein [Candidatus Ornithomonoglobus sp.]